VHYDTAGRRGVHIINLLPKYPQGIKEKEIFEFLEVPLTIS